MANRVQSIALVIEACALGDIVLVIPSDIPQSNAMVLSLSGEIVAALLPGDTDGDGDIDDADLGTAFANYTGPVGSGGGKTSAPRSPASPARSHPPMCLSRRPRLC